MLQHITEPIPRWPGEFVELASGRVYVRTATPVNGSNGAAGAAPALFIHGLGGSATNWTDLMGLLSQDPDPLACSALDLPGFGLSPPPGDRDYSITAHARTVIELIEQQGNWPVHLIGNSMGGAIATRVAGRRPDLVRSVILISPALPDLRPRLLPLRLAAVSSPGVGRVLMDLFNLVPPEQRTERTMRELYADPGVVHPIRRAEQIDDIGRRDELPYANEALIRSARGIVTEFARGGPGSLWRDAARIRVPVLVLHGSHDRLVNPRTAAKASRAFRGARVVILPNVGHVAMMERPALVAGEVHAFLAARSAAAVGAVGAAAPVGAELANGAIPFAAADAMRNPMPSSRAAFRAAFRSVTTAVSDMAAAHDKRG